MPRLLAALLAWLVFSTAAHATVLYQKDVTAADVEGDGFVDFDLPDDIVPHNTTVNILVEYTGMSVSLGGFDFSLTSGIGFYAIFNDDIEYFYNYEDDIIPSHYCAISNNCLRHLGPKRLFAQLTGPTVYASAADCYTDGILTADDCLVSLEPVEDHAAFLTGDVKDNAVLRVTVSTDIIPLSLASAPEPQVWAYLICGLLSVGLAFRRLRSTGRIRAT
jgi:hypothetical protein